MTASLAGSSQERADSPQESSPRRRVRWSMIVLCGLYTLLLLPGLFIPKVGFLTIVMGTNVFSLLAIIFAVRAATRRFLPHGVRRSWWLLSGGLLLLNLTPVGMVMSGTLGPGVDATTSFSTPLSWGDLFRLSAVLPLLAALLLVPRSNTTRRDGHKLLLDVVTVIGGSFMLLWYFVLGPVVTSDLPPLGMLVAAAYPIGDLTLIFGVLVVVLRGAHPATRRPMIFLFAGLLLFLGADIHIGYCKVHPGAVYLPALELSIVMTGVFLIAVAAVEQCRPPDDEFLPSAARLSSAGSRLPYAALAVGCVLLIVVSLRSGLYPWFGLILGAVVMTATVAVRQFVAMRENHTMIISDSLTGLSNRIRLHEGLARAVDRANRTGERTAVMLIDMNGFKQINDTLGHDAGDQLLVGFARLLKASVLGADIVARLGGDEFAIVLHNVGTAENARAVANRIITGMRDPVAVNGEPVCPSASIGIAITETGRQIPAPTLLHQADMAMYQAKSQPGNTYYLHQEDPSTEYANH